MMLPSRLGCPLSLKTPDMGNTGLDGSNTVGEKGLAVSDVTIRGLVINNFDVGISIGSNSVVEFNFIGVDPSGTVDLGNRLGIGVFGENNRIGGTGPGTGNLISGNDTGIWVGGTLGPSSMTTTIQGNLIGTNASGLGALGNREGIRLVYSKGAIIGGIGSARNTISGNVIGIQITPNSSDNRVIGNYIGPKFTGTGAIGNGFGITASGYDDTIGGTAPGEGNVISGNSQDGVTTDGALRNVFQGNLIGVAADGTTSMGNGGHGIEIRDSLRVVVGGADPGAGNVIAFNGEAGVFVQNSTKNPIVGNRIHSNGGLGIELANANNNQETPVLSTAAGNPTAISGTARGDNDTTFRIDFYQNTACDPSGSGEGESYLGSTDVTIDAGGEATFAAVPGQTVDLDAVITATATDPDDNTSEFSNCISVGPVVDSTGDAPDATPGDRLCDDGAEACTLRAAIQVANLDSNLTPILFNIPGAGPHTIQPSPALPEITEPVFIDGYSQPGAKPNTSTSTSTSTTSANSVLKIELDGTNVGAGTDTNGLVIIANGSTVQGLAINRFLSSGIRVEHNPDGSATEDISVLGNFIGTDVSGTTALGNGTGVLLVGINDTQIGSGDPADRNVIAGSVGFGVGFIGPNNSGMVVQGNFIGVGSDGVTPLGNGGDGVDIVGGFGNMIGGGARPWSNVIANNGGAGVNVRGSLRNAVLRNSIYFQRRLGHRSRRRRRYAK